MTSTRTRNAARRSAMAAARRAVRAEARREARAEQFGTGRNF